MQSSWVTIVVFQTWSETLLRLKTNREQDEVSTQTKSTATAESKFEISNITGSRHHARSLEVVCGVPAWCRDATKTNDGLDPTFGPTKTQSINRSGVRLIERLRW
jgi:hypothetical protein